MSDTDRLKRDICARADLYIQRAAESADGETYITLLWNAARELAADTGVEDDWEGVELAYDYHCDREGIPNPKERRA